MQDAEFQLLYHSGLANTDENKKKFGDIIQNFMSKSGASLHDISDAAKQEVRMFKGTPGGGLMSFPKCCRRRVESRLKGTSLGRIYERPHRAGAYDQGIRSGGDQKTGSSLCLSVSFESLLLKGIERAASYAVPILQSGLEVDPVETFCSAPL